MAESPDRTERDDPFRDEDLGRGIGDEDIAGRHDEEADEDEFEDLDEEDEDETEDVER